MTPVFSRRMALATGLSAVAAPALAIAPPKDITLQQDFDELWETIRDRYAYFEEKATDWDRVRAIYLPRLAEVGDDEDKWMTIVSRWLVMPIAAILSAPPARSITARETASVLSQISAASCSTRPASG